MLMSLSVTVDSPSHFSFLVPDASVIPISHPAGRNFLIYESALNDEDDSYEETTVFIRSRPASSAYTLMV